MTLDRIAWFIGEVARPVTIVMLGLSGAVSGVIIALKVSDGTDGGVFIGAFGALIGGIYFGKAWEIVKTQTARPEATPTQSGERP